MVSIALSAGAVFAVAGTGAAGWDFSTARLWAGGGIAAAPRIVLAGDGDGDGRADLFIVSTAGNGAVDFVRTSALGKPCFPAPAQSDFGKGGVAAVCGGFAGDGRASVLILLGDGDVRLLHDMNPNTGALTRNDLVARIPVDLLPPPPFQTTAADFNGDGRADALVVGRNGRALLLRNDRRSSGAVRFLVCPVMGAFPRPVRRLAASSPGTRGKPAPIIWMDDTGAIFRAAVEAGGDDRAVLGRPIGLLKADPRDPFTVGRFRGEDAADLLAGTCLVAGGDPACLQSTTGLPDRAAARGDFTWLAADLNGDGRDDLVRVRRSGERFVGDDVFVHFSGPDSGALVDTDDDGLPDAWETGTMKPGGLDLPALGCKPGKRDLIVEIQRFTDVPEDQVRSQMDRIVRYFAALPIANPDGSTGCALHLIYREPVPIEERNTSWQPLGEKYHPASHRGVTHWMVIYNAGGGQSDEMADRGSCGSHALYATFMHEFGHQLGLGHSGGWAPAWCPTYPSVMNYAYNYQRNGHAEDIGYSDGRLTSVVLNEQHLGEYVPLRPNEVAFLADPPYHYHLKPAPDGKGTLVDWNRNGVFGERNVVADINHGYSTTAGLRHFIGKNYAAPAPVAIGRRGERLLLFTGKLPAPPPRSASDEKSPRPRLSADLPGRLCVRTWQGRDALRDAERWSDEVIVQADDVIGDPSATCLGDIAWVAYPTSKGAIVRSVTLDRQGHPRIGADISALPGTAGCQVTITTLRGRLALLLWRGAQTPVELVLLDVSQERAILQSRQPLPLTSKSPVGAAEGERDGTRPILWVGLAHDQAPDRPDRWQVARLALGSDGNFELLQREWLGGEKGTESGAGRVVLLWQKDQSFGLLGQLYFFGSAPPSSCGYVVTRIGDRSVNGGWLTRRYYDEWTVSPSAPGACLFQGNIFYSMRWLGKVDGSEDNDYFVAFAGCGIETEPMGDFDDIGFIRDIGISRSIGFVVYTP
jgi:hypothetical protein